MSNLLTPKFLTSDIACRVTLAVTEGMLMHDAVNGALKREMFHVVVMVPAIEDARPDYGNYPNYPIQPFMLFEHSVGESEWPHEFDNIARCKALQLWRGQNVDGQTDSVVHLLFPDDTPYWGGVKRHGIVVACSGVQPWFDQMISGMIADGIKAYAREAYERSTDKREGLSFLT